MKKGSLASASHRDKERGNVLVYTVLSVLFLFFAVGLGVDISHLYLAKTELQNAADAAALAGASALSMPDTDKIGTAVDRAVNTMNLNKYNFNNRTFAAVMDTTAQRALVTFAINLSGPYISEAAATASPTNIRFIKVVTPSVPINVLFAIPLLGSSRNLDAKATAGLSIPGNVRYCLAPLSAIQCNPGDANCQLPANFQGTCPTAGIQTYTRPDGTTYTCDPTKEFCKKCTYTIRAAGATGPSPGNYNVLACAGNGASAVRQALASYGDSCRCGPVSPNDQIETEPGVQAGPIAQGLNVRFDQYGGGLSYSSAVPPDRNRAEGTSSGNGSNQTWTGISWTQYQAGSPFTAPAQGHTGVANRRVLVIPIIPIGEFGNGRTTVTVSSLGGFFMRSEANGTNGDIKVEYIGDDIVGVVGFDPNGGNTTNVVTPVLYR